MCHIVLRVFMSNYALLNDLTLLIPLSSLISFANTIVLICLSLSYTLFWHNSQSLKFICLQFHLSVIYDKINIINIENLHFRLFFTLP